MIKVISFDLDGTLMHPDFGNKVWLEGLPTVYAKEKHIPLNRAKEKLITAYNSIGQTRKEWYDLTYWIKKLNLSIKPLDLLQEYKAYIKPYAESFSVVSHLAKQYQLIISSSAMREFITMELTESKMSSFFSHFFSATSDTDSAIKNPSFYKQICSKLKIVPTEIVHVGDTKLLDYDYPKEIGMIPFYLQRGRNSRNPFIIHSLKEFEKQIIKMQS